MLSMRVFAVLILLALGACNGNPAKLDPKLVTQKVEVAVASSCVPKDVAKEPAYPDAALTPDTDPATRYLLVAASDLLRKARLKDLEPVIAGCR